MKVNELLESKYGDISIRADKAIKLRQRSYATTLTKQDLIKMGVVDVDTDNLVVYGINGPFSYIKHNQGYFMIQVYEVDENGNKIKLPKKLKYKAIDGTIHEYDSWMYKPKLIGLHRILWAWKYGCVPEGKVIDHINNKHNELEDYKLDNLQCISPKENVIKEKDITKAKVVKVKRKTVEFYESKLNDLIPLYEAAKLNKQAELAHRLRGKISHAKGCIRYLMLNGGGNE